MYVWSNVCYCQTELATVGLLGLLSFSYDSSVSAPNVVRMFSYDFLNADWTIKANNLQFCPQTRFGACALGNYVFAGGGERTTLEAFWRFGIKQVTRSHKIVADGWAGTSNPPPHPLPSPHTHIYAKSI